MATNFKFVNQLIGAAAIGFLISGCASFAHSPYACKATASEGLWYGWAYTFIGNTFQIGECAAIKSLKVETGDYYFYNKKQIDYEVQRKIGVQAADEVKHFAMAFNCSPDAFEKFHETLIQNKDSIFGPDFDRSPRAVTKSVQSLIDIDELLKNSCR